MSETTKPKQAATVILLRPDKGPGFEVFLTRRPDGMAFLGGMYCFPGGTVRKEDGTDGMLRQCRGLTGSQARKIVGAYFKPQEALGVWVAAVREVFEETGILLACKRSGHPLAFNSELARRLSRKHIELTTKAGSFQALLESENLLCDLASLGYFSYWQTPAQFAMRFNTRFFIARLPKDQTPLATTPEVAHSVWLTADRALQLFARGELPMIFPTFASLRALADYASLESVTREFLDGNAALRRSAAKNGGLTL
jgi:8-oxo-dGTP pyrophosphatase MutT (NUDIX family)